MPEPLLKIGVAAAALQGIGCSVIGACMRLTPRSPHPCRPPLQVVLLFGATVLYTTLLSGPPLLGPGAAAGAGLLLGAGGAAAAAAWPTVGGIALPVVLFAGAGGLLGLIGGMCCV